MENLAPGEVLDPEKLSFDKFREEVLKDYRSACESREASLLGRKEVLTGKAKFGIFGDGKEVPQVAMAKFSGPEIFMPAIIVTRHLPLRRGQPQSKNFSRSYMRIRIPGMTRKVRAGR